MRETRKIGKRRLARDRLTVSHRQRLIEELRSDPELVSEYLRAAAVDSDSRVYVAALRTVAQAQG